MRVFRLLFLLFFAPWVIMAQRADSTRRVPAGLPIRFSNSSVVPVYRSRQDSIDLSAVSARLQDVMSKPRINKIVADSLIRVQDKIMREGIIGSRVVYFASTDFIAFADLKGLKADTVKRLSIEGYRGRKLPAVIKSCTQLEELELVNTRIDKVQRLPSLKKLKELTVYNNKPRRTLRLGRNRTIARLAMRTDAPATLPESYGSLRALATLDLSRCGLEQFPRLTGARTLTNVVLVYNRLTLSDASVAANTHVERINLQFNKITAVPTWIANFTALKKLDLNNNEITSIAPAVGNLRQLETLGLYKNKLTDIPPALFSLTNLREIDLYYNQISEVPASVDRWQRLERLYLSYNPLFRLPESLGNLPALTELYLHDNRLFQLPASIRQLTGLRVLRINNNLFTALPDGVSELVNLENLDVARNQLTTLPEPVYHFSKLKILSLVANRWDEPTQVRLREWAVQLRQQQTTVHLNSFDETED